jgi:hypothetical protein
MDRELLASAISIGDELVASAIHGADGECHWISWTASGSSKPKQEQIPWTQQASPYLYDGGAGVCLFLGYLCSATGEATYGEVCRAGLKWVVRRHLEGAKSWGLYSGGAGIAYACIRAGQAISDPSLESTGWRLLSQVEFQTTAGVDVISGAAGTLLALVACFNDAPDKDLLRAKLRAGARSLSRMVDHSHIGWAWRVPMFPAPLTGYAHGTAGVAHALLEVFSILGDEDWIPYAVAEGFRYEDHYARRDSNRLDWPDLRNNPAILARIPGQELCMRVWCYGSVGMAYSRLRAFEILGKAECLDDANCAWNSSAASVSSALDLCHGAGGMTELDLEFYRVFSDAKYLEHARIIAQHCVLTRSQSGTWFNGTNVPDSDPSLMQGLAGMGLALLRIALRGDIPSVLFPRSTSRCHATASRTPQGPDALALESFRWDHVRGHFPTTSSLLELAPWTAMKAVLAGVPGSSTSDLLAFSERVATFVEENGSTDEVEILLDCVNFERLLLEVKMELPRSKDLFRAPLSPNWNELDFDQCVFVTSSGVRITRSAWNWKEIGKQGTASYPAILALKCPTTFAFFPYEETAESLRVTPLVGLIWKHLQTALSGSALMERCLADVAATDRLRLAPLIRAQMEQLYKAQMVTLAAAHQTLAAA